MRFLLIGLLFVLLSFRPGMIWGGDGDHIPSPARHTSNWNIASWYLCDGKVAADEGVDCSPVLSEFPELPDWYHFKVNLSTDCTAYSIDIETLFDTSSDPYTVCTLALPGAPECWISTEMDGPLERIIQAELNNITNCTDLDVIAEFYQKR
jgi:hypothetical protein